MGASCFCGCGRPVKGVRLRAANSTAADVTERVAALHGTLDNDAAGAQSRDVRSLAAEGDALVAALTTYVHGETERGDLDKAGITEWLRRARAMPASLAAGSTGPAWEPDDRSTAMLGPGGVRAVGVITDVQKAGWGNERVADLAIAVSTTAPDGTPLELRRELSIAVIKAPRVGDRVEVAYDAADPDRFVYRPHLDLDRDT
jgi:hypothetical protein